MDCKHNWKSLSHHSFDMSEYIFGERFELGGVSFDEDESPLEEAADPKAAEAREEIPHLMRRA